MAIRSISVQNVLGFERMWRKDNGDPKAGGLKSGDKISDAFHLEFAEGINVLIGANGTGKTTLLKMIYAATQWSIEQTDPGKTDKLNKFFSFNLKDSESLKNIRHPNGYCAFEISDGTHKFQYSLSHKGFVNWDDWLGLNIQSVMIPTTEMLSHSKGFLAMNMKYNLPFDGTQIDIIVNASLPEAREMSESMNQVLKKISQAIGGEVYQDEETFYIKKTDGKSIEFSLEAEGLRKLGLIWKLIRNGLLETGTILLWDEPEANLNPELFPLVAEILLALQNNGVQIFVATHSYNFAKYLEIRRAEPGCVLFHSLYKGSSAMPESLKDVFKQDENYNDVIYSKSAYTMEELRPNIIMEADVKLLDEIYDMR